MRPNLNEPEDHADRASDAFDVAGPTNAPALVLVHGSVVTRKIWLPQLRDLCDHYRVIAPDLPGHGALARVPFSFQAATTTLAEIIRKHAHGRAVLVGLSLGGYVAIELAHRHPDLVAGLVLSGSSANFVGWLGLYLKMVSALMRRGWLSQSRAQAERKTRRLFSPALADVADAQLQAGVYPEPLAAAFAEMAGRDYTIPLATYPGPGLILNGEKDTTSRRGEARFLAAMRHGQLEVVAGAGHACNLDRPEAFNRAVRAFLGNTVLQSGTWR
jgi:pimeloyl-ACP methyl ester carboxylesterase